MNKVLTLFISLVFIVGCEKNEPTPQQDSSSIVTHTNFAGNFYYDPPNITISQGDEIKWINDGGIHDLNGEINSLTNLPFDNPETFNSPSTSIVGAEIYRHTFNTAGLYKYDCSVGGHALNGMTATISVISAD